MSFTSFQNYLSKTYDDSNETNWFSENTWGQFVNIEPQIITQFKEAISYFTKNTKSLEPIKETKETKEIKNVKSILRIKSTRTLDLENNILTSQRELNCEKDEKETLTKYTYFSITGMLLCIYIYVNSQV
jgi:hypothetical protein